MDRFDIAEVYALHNAPGLEFGRFSHNAGADHGSGRYLYDQSDGQGGHGARAA